MIAAGFCSQCGERRDCRGCSCSPTPKSYGYLVRYTEAHGGISYQAMHSGSYPLCAATQDRARAERCLSHWSEPGFGSLAIRAELYDGDSGLWVSELGE